MCRIWVRLTSDELSASGTEILRDEIGTVSACGWMSSVDVSVLSADEYAWPGGAALETVSWVYAVVSLLIS